jgi:hypothetical protein
VDFDAVFFAVFFAAFFAAFFAGAFADFDVFRAAFLTGIHTPWVETPIDPNLCGVHPFVVVLNFRGLSL